ncbi:aminomethyl-transferring glycine dehydrogenase subunit GcvPA [Anatilimnocola floriformis]|uniref:aminomethyl-transferring glycine dehydrogenase subunit GcvPA n=1 Tax=Anatilimnocola floriformis TaxID=2948575 RepID=UPI0020C241BD|nr:aminomethyl-transferring glycine dehydrogenase subunit GcvPA [Anatilimnocola floriformis]
MPYTYNTPDDERAMLQSIGVASVQELFQSVPEEFRLQRPLDLPPALGELELTQHISALAAKNANAQQKACFLGGGSYDHFVPAVVDALASRGEFYTSYTPYQPEVSQGNLQVMFEYQSLICQLTGMDVSNASLYDGGSAVAEAVLLAMSVTGRNRVVVPASMHPEYRQILQTYFACIGGELVTVPTPSGVVSVADVAAVVNGETACVVVQHPNFFGGLEDVAALSQVAHDAGALLIHSFDPISLGVLKRPGDLGADVAVAEGQSLGTPMLFGGPYLGIMACKEQFVRRMPGRIAGQTVDRRGRRCWVLTLQTREQHIRREKATSNICTNQGLFALRAAIYLTEMGPQGLREVAELCVRKAHYAREQITSHPRFTSAFEGPTFKEFVVRDTQGRVGELIEQAADAGYLAGVPLAPWYPDLADCFLVAVTEKRTKPEIDGLVQTLATTLRNAAPRPHGAVLART